MPHPEREHELQIALATALRERDEARERWTHFLNQATAADAALAAANARAEKAEAKVRWYQTTDFAESLAAARRECEGLRAALSDLIQEMNFGGGCDGNDPSCDGCVAVEAARAALASPAAAPAAGRAKIVGNFMCDKCKVGDHGNHHPGYGGICLGCACEWLPPPEPVAPEKEIANLLGRGHVRNPREGEPGDAETYSSPAALLPRVLAALEIIDRQGTIGVTTLIRSLAAELRAYIAERKTSPASAREMYWYEQAHEAWRARDSAVAVNEADLKDLTATKDRADAAEKRIAELERVIELSYPFVAEGDENTTVDGLTQEQIVRHINSVMRAAKAKGEGR